MAQSAIALGEDKFSPEAVTHTRIARENLRFSHWQLEELPHAVEF
jgi:hypothetical protein